jgi:uncharacterized membrane protein (DUF485 family)
MRLVSSLIGTILALVAACLIAYGARLISYSFQPVSDSPYWIFGVGLLLLALPFLLSAWWIFSDAPGSFARILVVLIAFGVAWLSLATRMFGSPVDEIIRLALVWLAFGSLVASVRSRRSADGSDT